MPLTLDGCRRFSLLALAALIIAADGHPASAQTPRQKPRSEAVEPPSDSELYCKNIAEAASEARIQWQTWKLISLEASLRDRIAELQRKEREFEKWVKRREDLMNEVEDQADGTCHFGVNIIPHTQEVTTWGGAREGDAINLEIDMLARYVARLAEKD